MALILPEPEDGKPGIRLQAENGPGQIMEKLAEEGEDPERYMAHDTRVAQRIHAQTQEVNIWQKEN